MKLLSTQQRGVYVDRAARVALAAIAQTRTVTIHDDGMSAPIDWLASGGAQLAKDCLDGQNEVFAMRAMEAGDTIDRVDLIEDYLNESYAIWEADQQREIELQQALVRDIAEVDPTLALA